MPLFLKIPLNKWHRRPRREGQARGEPVGEVASKNPITLRADQTLGQVRDWIEAGSAGSGHQGYPIVDEWGDLVGVLTRRTLLDRNLPQSKPLRELIKTPMTVFADTTLREAADLMVGFEVGRLPVVDKQSPKRVIGMITRSDVLSAHRRRLSEFTDAQRSIELRKLRLSRWFPRNGEEALVSPRGS